MSDRSYVPGFEFGSVLGGGLAASFVQTWPALIASALLSAAPPATFLSLGLTPMQFGAMGPETGGWSMVALIAVVAGVGALATLFVQAVATLYAVSYFEGGRPDWPEAVRVAVRLFPLLIVVAILFGLAVGLGFLLLIVPGLFLMSLWFVLVPVYLAERHGVFGAFSRAARLTENHRWSMFGLVVVLSVIQLGVSLVVGALSVPLAGAFGTLAPQVQPWLSSGAGGIGGVIWAVVAAAAFCDLRIARGESAGPRLADAFD